MRVSNCTAADLDQASLIFRQALLLNHVSDYGVDARHQQH